MIEPYVVQAVTARWVIHPPYEAWDHGASTRVTTELHDGGMRAATDALVLGRSENRQDLVTFGDFVQELAADRGGALSPRPPDVASLPRVTFPPIASRIAASHPTLVGRPVFRGTGGISAAVDAHGRS